jgi:pimeloyl-ACP methyl ester carboxylesterase
MAPPSNRFEELPGGRFHFLDHGDASAPVVVLLHGFNQTAHSWDEFAGWASEAGFRAIALDQRGHGDTSRAPGGDYGREAMADDPVHLADAIGVDRFAAIGMSMGAVHAVLVAARHPERTRALVIVDWAPEVEASGVAVISQVASLSWASFDEAVEAMRLYNPRRSADNIRARLAHSLGQSEDGRWRWKVDSAGLASHPRFREPPDAMWRALGQVSCPALVVRGAQSPLVSDEAAARVVAALPQGTLVTVPDAAHSVPGDNPAGFRSAVADFLRQHARG